MVPLFLADIDRIFAQCKINGHVTIVLEGTAVILDVMPVTVSRHKKAAVT